MKPYDDRHWKVEFKGLWDKGLLKPIVELRTQADIDAKFTDTAYHEMSQYRKYKLIELHREKDEVAWYISNLRKGRKEPEDKKASFTVHRGEKAISDYLPMIAHNKSCYNFNQWRETKGEQEDAQDPGEIKISTYLAELLDVYTYLATVTKSRDAEIPIISPVNVTVKPAKRITIDLRTAIRHCRNNKEGAQTKEYPPRPIFTKSGTITFDFDQSNILSVYNATTCDFVIQRMGVITSLCNTRGMNVSVDRGYTWFSNDYVEVLITFGNSTIDDHVGKKTNKSRPINGVVEKKENPKSLKTQKGN